MSSLSTEQLDLYKSTATLDSYIAINRKGIVVDLCPANADVVRWMEGYTKHHFLITSTLLAVELVGKPLPDGEVDVMLL